jgi:hypothetical protein
VDADRTADLARMLIRQGLVAEALDALETLAEQSAAPGLVVDLDDEDRVTVEVGFDPVLVERLRRLPGAARDRDAALWRVSRAGHVGLVDLLERLARPPCSPELGCTLDDDAPPSSAHRDAHERACGGS